MTEQLNREVCKVGYIMYVPTGAKTPSVTIQIPNGEIGRFEKTGTATVRLLFATWDTGKNYLT